MASESSRPTPLGVARARFVEGLPRKANELKGSVALLAGTPDDERAREELRRRLHALYASSQVFQITSLSGALKDAINRLDEARDQRRSLSDDDIDALALLAATLPALGESDETPVVTSRPPRGGTLPSFGAVESERPSLVSAVSAPPPARAAKRATTLQGLPSVPVSAPEVSEAASAEDDATTSPGALPSPLAQESPLAAPSLRAPGVPQVEAPRAPDAPPASQPRASAQQAPPPLRATPPVVSVLVVDGAEHQAKVRALLPAERFEVLGAADPEEALRLSRSSAPDVVLADLNVLRRDDVDLVARLHDDPLTDFVPVVAMIPSGSPLDVFAVRAMGADDAIQKPLDASDLEALLSRHGGVLESVGAQAGLIGELTVEEIADRLAHELRRGLVESVDRGHDVAVPVGDGASILSAAWSAIGRVRAQLAQQSGGRVHFRDRPAAGGPAFLSLVEDDAVDVRGAKVSLRDRRVIVADDDPAVVWFFAGLLREEGAIVEEAADGAEALDLARKSRPDVIISDILMPRLDGFALTREVRRDPALADVPVILLSWKEDFLQRMRELSSGASGYLRKEAGSAQILDAVRDVLRPRARLEARLAAGGDVRGRLDRMGVVPLLKTASLLRRDARVTVRDAWNLFELDLRGGKLVDATRTASDGSFSRGPRVILPLLGASGGRYAVSDADTAVRASIKEPLDDLLRRTAARLGAVVDAVSGRGLSQAANVELDDDVVASLLRTSPEPFKDVVEALRAGGGPRQLLLDGKLAPHELESVMIDLARQGAIHAVRGPDGEDRVALALAARGETAFPARRPSALPPAMMEKLAAEADEAPSAASDATDLSWLPHEEKSADIVAEAHRLASEPPAKDPDPPSVEEALEPRASDVVPAPGLIASGQLPSHDPLPSGILELDDPGEPPRSQSNPVAAPMDLADDEDDDDAAPFELTPPPRKAPKPVGEMEELDASELDSVPPSQPPGPSRQAAEPVRAARSESAPAKPARPTPPPPKPAESEPPPADSSLTPLGFGFVLLACFAVGYFIWLAVRPSLMADTASGGPEVGDVEPGEADPGGSVEDGVPDTDTTPPTAPDEEPDLAMGAATVGGYGREVEGIAAELGVPVPPGQGLVVLEVPSDGVPVSVRIGGREHLVSDAPRGLALAPGVHDVAFVRGDDISFRFVRVRAGTTRYVPAP